jgi:hypothetical protein
VANVILGADYLLNTDYFLQNSFSSTTITLHLDTSTTVQDTGTTPTDQAMELKHISETNTFALANFANFKFI